MHERRRALERHAQVLGFTDLREHRGDAMVETPARRRSSAERAHTVAHKVGHIHALERPLEECAQLVNAAFQAPRRGDGDVLDKNRLQPCAFARLRIHEHHHPERTVAVEGVLGVRPYHDAARLTPFAVVAADGDASVEGDDDLNRVVRMHRHDALSSGREEETSLPQVPARNTQPAIRLFVVGLVGQAGILAAGA